MILSLVYIYICVCVFCFLNFNLPLYLQEQLSRKFHESDNVFRFGAKDVTIGELSCCVITDTTRHSQRYEGCITTATCSTSCPLSQTHFVFICMYVLVGVIVCMLCSAIYAMLFSLSRGPAPDDGAEVGQRQPALASGAPNQRPQQLGSHH